jgi:2-dehydropantoate 2-reductase
MSAAAMRILVLGAGATGGYFGGRLAEAGADVTFLVRGRRAEQLGTDGLVVRSPAGDITRKVATIAAGDLAPDYDVVLLSCKAYDLADAIAAVAPAVGPQTAVLPVLNGMRHLDALDAAFGPTRVLGGLCAIAATLEQGGTIRHMSPFHLIAFGERSGAPSPRCAALAEAFGCTRCEWRLSETILQEMWEKWVLLASLAAATCLMRASVGHIVATPEGEAFMREMLEESRSVAAAEGYPPREKPLEQARRLLTERGSRFTASMLRDVERGGPVEAEHIIDDLLARGRSHGLALPLLRVASIHLGAYEAARRDREAGKAS